MTSRALVAVLFVVSVIVLPVVTTTIQVQRFQSLSPLDEPAHLDYLRQIYDFHLPRMGEKLRNDTREDIACRGIDGRAVGRCADDEHDLRSFDAKGFAYEAQQPPLYYVVTSLLMRPVGLVVNGFVNQARLLGAAWTAAGLALFWWCLRRRGASPVVTAMACVLLGFAPLFVTQAATVTNDAASLLIGVLVLVGYLALREDQRARVVALAATGSALLVFTKPLAILPIGAATLALLVELVVLKRPLKTIGLAAVPGIVALLAYEAWQTIRDARAIVPYHTVTAALLGFRPLEDFQLSVAIATASKFMPVYWTTDGPLAHVPYIGAVTFLVGLFFVVSPSVSTAMGDGTRDLRLLQVGVLFVLLAAPPLLVVQSYLDVKRLGGTNPRYALSMLPLMIPCVVPWFERRGPRWFGAFLLVGLTTATIYCLANNQAPSL